MTENKNIHEDFLKQLVQKSRLESPSPGFTDRLMERVIADTIKTPVLAYFSEKWIWTLVAGSFAAMLACIVWYEWTPMLDFFRNIKLAKELEVFFLTLFQQVITLFAGVKISPVILASGLALFTFGIAGSLLRLKTHHKPEYN